MAQSKEIWKKTFILTIAGGMAFWMVNFIISLTSIAAEYRTALSIPYLPMLLEALLGGLIIGFSVSNFLLRFFDPRKTKNPVLKAVSLSCIALVIVTILIEIPGKFFTETEHAVRYFLIGTTFNALRIFALGITIGYLYKNLHKRFSSSITVARSAQAE